MNDDPVFQGPWGGREPPKPPKKKTSLLTILIGWPCAIGAAVALVLLFALLPVAAVVGVVSFIIDCIENIRQFYA